MRFVLIFINAICWCLLMSACNTNEPVFTYNEDTELCDLSYLNQAKLQVKRNQEPSRDDVIRVLAIGNSYTENALQTYLYSILAAKHKKVEIATLTKSSSSLAEQLKLGMKDENNFLFHYLPLNSEEIIIEDYAMQEALCYAQWNYVSLQQYSRLSGKPESINPYLPYLLTFVQNNVPYNAKIVWHQTWAYETNYTNTNFAVYNFDQEYMYSSICSTCDLLLNTYDFFSLVPCGTAVQKARSSQLSSLLSQDGTHLCKPVGCYLVSCVWAEFLIDIPATKFVYYPSEMTQEEANIVQTCAHEAILEWKNRQTCE